MALQENSHRQPELVEPLTDRELEILRLVADGWTDRKIAEHLVLAIDTVKWYNKRVYSKLFVKNRTEAVKRARELGLLDVASTQSEPLEGVSSRHNLPAATTPFVGRELELGDLAALLAHEEIRLVTILAVGGMGKTRLALEAAKSQLGRFLTGVYLIPLAQLRTVDHIIPTIAAHLNMQLPTSAEPAAQLLDYLHNKTTLLLLDSFEHLLDGAGLITMLLEAAPHIKIVVTTRERLNLRGETVYALGGLALPTGSTRAETLNCSAVQLFIQRVQLVRANATVPDAELPHVSYICRQVGGMPLGIELASSLVDVLSPEEIAAEIEQNFDILATDMRDMPRRLRSLRAVFDSTWSRLTQTERGVYRRLAVFRAGFTREAAQAVAGAKFRMLKTLASKSLLQRDADRERYVIHELLRQYAEEQLDASGTAAATHQAHMNYYTDLMAQHEIRIKGHGQLEALNQIEADFDNIRSAWQWAVEQAGFDAIDRSLEALYWFCNMRARVPEGEKLFQQAREQFGISPTPDAHPVQRRLLLRFDASGEGHRTQIEQMLALARQTGDQQEITFFLWMLGVNRYVSRDFNRATTILEEALDLCQRRDDDFYATELLHLLGICARFTGRVEEARAFEKQVRELSRRSGNKYALGRALGSQGLIAVFEGATAQAKSDLQEAIAIRRELGDQAGVAVSLMSLSQEAFFRGDFSTARTRAEESLALATDVNSLFPKSVALGMLAWLAAMEEAYDQAWALAREGLALAPDPNTFAAQLALALAACGLENYAAAREHIQTLLASGSPWHTARGLMSCLPVLAILYASQDDAARAVEVLTLALTHPTSPTAWMEKWMLLSRLQTRLERDLGPENYAAAWERGRQRALETVLRDFSSLQDQW